MNEALNFEENEVRVDKLSATVVDVEWEKELGININSASELLDRDFQQFMAQVSHDQSMDRFRLEYEKIYRAFKKTNDQEKRLVKKCRELNSEVANSQNKLKTALRLSQEDQTAITSLQKEMEKTWKLVYLSQEKETRATEKIDALNEELVELNQLIEQDALKGAENDQIIAELKKANDDLKFQLNDQTLKSLSVERSVQHHQKINHDLQTEYERATATISDVSDQLNSKDKELQREIRKREKFQKECGIFSVLAEESKKTVDKLNHELKMTKQHLAETNVLLKESKGINLKYVKDYETLFVKSTKLGEDLEIQIQKNKDKRLECIGLENDLKYSNQQLGMVQAEKMLLERKLEKEQRDVSHYREMAESSKIPLLVAHTEIEGLKNEILNWHKVENDLNRKYDLLVREKEKQIHVTEKAEQKVKENLTIINQHTVLENTLSVEINVYREEVSNLKKTIQQMERDRDKLSSEITQQRDNYTKSEEEVKVLEIEINILNLKIVEQENKMRHQLNLFETIRLEKNELSKSFFEMKEEYNELKVNSDTSNHHLSQLKDELALKEQIIAKEQYEVSKLEKIRDSLQGELAKKSHVILTDHELEAQQDIEIKKLSSLLKHTEEELSTQKREYERLFGEKETLGALLVHRGDEINLLTGKNKAQAITIKNNETQLVEKSNDIQLLRTKIRDVTREYNLTKNSGSKISGMKYKILRLERELLQEKTRVTALCEELENPMNIHRWRKLEGTDPTAFELIQKNQVLQKKLIQKNEEVIEKNTILQEKEEEFKVLKELVSNQPGPEINDQINTFQRNIQSKNKQLKTLASELTMHQAQSNEYKYEIERLNCEIVELKKKYYMQKRNLELETMNANAQSNNDDDISMIGQSQETKMPPMVFVRNNNFQAVPAKSTRYAGGGFAIK